MKFLRKDYKTYKSKFKLLCNFCKPDELRVEEKKPHVKRIKIVEDNGSKTC